jgi:hypothetical protein
MSKLVNAAMDKMGQNPADVKMASISKQNTLAGRITAQLRAFCFDIFAILTPRTRI